MNRPDLRRVFHLTPYQTAQQTLLNNIRLYQESEEIVLSESLGRVLSEDVVSAVNIPDSNRVYDGYGKNLAKFQRLQLGYIKDQVVAYPIHGGSSQLFSLVNSNGFAIIPTNHNLRKGQKINVTLYNTFEFACYKHWPLSHET